MQDNPFLSFPFLTRDMVDWEFAANIKLRVVSQSWYVGELILSGATKQGLFTFKHTTTANGAEVISDFAMPDFPLFLTLADPTPWFLQGGCRARVELLVNGNQMFTYCSGPVYKSKPISYPYSRDEDKVPGGGEWVYLSSVAPSPGHEANYSVPDNAIFRIMAVQIGLQTSATVANRRVRLSIHTGMSQPIEFWGSINQPAAAVRYYTFAASGTVPDEDVSNNIFIPIPPNLLVPSDYKIATLTTNMQAGDQFGPINLFVERYFR